MSISPELTLQQMKYLVNCIGARAALIDQVMRDSTSMEERLQLAAQLDQGAELSMRFAILIQIAEKEGA